jgi:hypothetical protein
LDRLMLGGAPREDFEHLRVFTEAHSGIRAKRRLRLKKWHGLSRERRSPPYNVRAVGSHLTDNRSASGRFS